MNNHLPSRRTLLKSAALAAAVAAAPARAAADPAPLHLTPHPDPFAGLKVGVASYSLRKLPLDAAIKAIRRVKLSYVSIKDVHLPLKSTAEERQAVAQKFRDAGITPLSCGVIVLPNDEAVCRNAFQYARDIGAPTIVCHPDPPALPMLDSLVKEFKDIRLAIHNHGPEDKRFPSPYNALKAIDKLDERIGVCIDVGHCARAGADPAQAVRDCRARLFDMHLKDISDPHGKNAGVAEVECGRGVLDLRALMAALREVNFPGHVGFEHEPNADDPLPGLAESVGYIKGVLAA